MQLKDAKLFINPASGRWRGKKLANKIYDYLDKHGFKTDLSYSNSTGGMIDLVKQAVINGHQTIIVAGGDGTINEAINGIMLAKENNNDLNVSLGIIPLGTGNDFIKAAKIPKHWRDACDRLLSNKTQKIDLAKVTTKNKSSYFINNIGSGFDAGIGITASRMPIIKGKIVYIIGLIWHLIKGVPNPEIEYSIDGVNHKSAMTLTAVTNGTTYGGSFNIAPQASINDGFLDVIIAPALGRITAIPLLVRLLFGTHLKRKDVVHTQCKEFHLKSDIPIPVIADGEIIDEACLEYSIQILVQELNLIC